MTEIEKIAARAWRRHDRREELRWRLLVLLLWETI